VLKRDYDIWEYQKGLCGFGYRPHPPSSAIIPPSLWLVIAPTHTLQLVLVDTSKDFPEIRSLEVSALRQYTGSTDYEWIIHRLPQPYGHS
jgi:hypothetical protein